MQVQPSLISPAENFDLYYFLRNPTDTTTYYVQAVIYDVRTGVVLLTTPLVQSATNPHLFIQTVQAPTDAQSIGRNIVAIASVYIDSGYTTKSDAYEEQESYFLVKAVLQNPGGMIVDYNGIRDMMQEVVDTAFNNIPKPKPTADAPALPDMPFDSVFGALGALQREINRIPKDSVDLKPLQDSLATISASITQLPAPTPQIDLAPLIEAFNALKATIEGSHADLKQTTVDLPAYFIKPVIARLDEMQTSLDASLTKTIESQEFSFPLQKKVVKNPPAAPVPVPADMSHLTG